MTLEDLRVFVAVAEARSMGEVARRSGRSQPAVAQHVRRLEREMGAPLVHRHPRGASLTAAGTVLYQRAALALHALSSARTEIEAARVGSNDTLALSASEGSTHHLLKPAILKLKRRWPDLALKLHVGTTVEQRLEAVRRRSADLALVTLTEPRAGFAVRPLVEVPLLLLVNRGDPLAERKRLSLRALGDIRYVALQGSSTIEFVRKELEAEGIHLGIARTVESPATAILYVELGLGHTFVPAIQLQSLARNRLVRAVRIVGLPAVPLGWAALDFDILPEVAREFLRIVDGSVRAPNR